MSCSHTHSQFADYLGEGKVGSKLLLVSLLQDTHGLCGVSVHQAGKHSDTQGCRWCSLGRNSMETATGTQHPLQEEHAGNHYTVLGRRLVWQNSWQAFATSMKLSLTKVISHQLLKITFSFWSETTDVFIFKFADESWCFRETSVAEAVSYSCLDHERVSLRFLSTWITRVKSKGKRRSGAKFRGENKQGVSLCSEGGRKMHEMVNGVRIRLLYFTTRAASLLRTPPVPLTAHSSRLQDTEQ